MEKVVRKAMVTAAGKGSQWLPATQSQPKEMLPVGRKPVIQAVCYERGKEGRCDGQSLLMI